MELSLQGMGVFTQTTVKKVGYVMLGIQILCWTNIIDLGSLIEWLATFYILGYFLSIGADLRHMDLMFVHK